MNCHQVLSGACNAGDRCFAVGSVEGVPFTAYAAGCNIVILASTFERVQIIPGATHGYIKISALDCSTDTGKISAAYENRICIFEPTPVILSEKHYSHNLDYRWVQTGFFVSPSHVITLSWNLEGTRLLTGGSTLQLWKEKVSEKKNVEEEGVKFVIGDRESKTPTDEKIDDTITWDNIWSCQTAIPIYHMAFSPDGTLFATCGRNDRLVKIWYENNQVLFPTKIYRTSQNILSEDTNLNFTYIYIAHPRAVTYLSWRKTSKYMPKGSVSNMIVTSCFDNICRIWIETVLPDDGLVNLSQFDPSVSQNPKFRTHRHKHRFMQRLKHMKTCFHIRRHAKNGIFINNEPITMDNNNHPSLIPSLPSSCSVHDFHSYGYHGTGVTPGMHFHLAASINAETDIPLVPSMHSADISNQNGFILHWLNNKEMHFTIQAEDVLQEFTKKIIGDEYPKDDGNKSSVGRNDHITQDNLEIHKIKSTKIPVKSVFVDDNNSDGYSNKKHVGQNIQLHNNTSMSNNTSLNSLINENLPVHHLADSLDNKIDALLRDWHRSPDLLFSIHPVDGSYLIWVIEWLEDYYPGSFRQAQVSFSTRIPSAFPLGDAMSMSTMVSLYNTGSSPLIFREIVNTVKNKYSDDILTKENQSKGKILKTDSFPKESIEESSSEPELNESITNDVNITTNFKSDNNSPTVSMVTKHSNGTLNLWQLTFAYKTNFTQVLSIGHVSRASGHRFRVNDITCHPILPLLLSTSHHNLPETNIDISPQDKDVSFNKNVFSPSGFCSELILWRVDAVGPLNHSGGVSELARINSPEISAFSNVAWIPTLLPSTTLGSFSNSPSACFVASDGENLRVYQAVIDARTLLAELSDCEKFTTLRKASSTVSLYSNSSSIYNDINHKSSIREKIKVVSQQSTARPGCIIQLNTISDAKHDWQNTQFLHVFQAQLITGGIQSNVYENSSPAMFEYKKDSMVDSQQHSEFEEPFYVVIIEKTTSGSTIHMWRIIISSKSLISLLSESAMYVPDSNITQELDDTDTGSRMSEGQNIIKSHVDAPHINITTKKMCTQELPLPEGVDVIHASPAAGHLSSCSIYPACFAPYIIVTACSDSVARFWKCEPISPNNNGNGCNSFKWSEWNMFSQKQASAIEIPGQPLNISAAYSGRIACAYKYGKSFTRPNKGNPDSRYINLSVGIYECESTGGSQWILEDTINLRNIYLPRINIEHGIDLSYLNDSRVLQKKQRINQVIQTFTHDDSRVPRSGDITPELVSNSTSGLLAVPSFSTLQSLRKSIAENGNTCPLTQKHLVQLDWVSKEDGSHILTVAVGSKILLYTPVSSDLAQANIKAMKESRSTKHSILRKTSSLAQSHCNDEIRWMKLRQIDLQTTDGLPPLPMQISWVRDGILVVGMDSEMHVYSQWKPHYVQNYCVEDLLDTRNLRDEDLRPMANELSQLRFKSISSVPLMTKISGANIQYNKDRKKRNASSSMGNVHLCTDSIQIHDYMTDYGLFQASRIACPVLPQYHPKQLMELLNRGKIRWVKAILAHLVRCMSDPELYGLSTDEESAEGGNRRRSWSRSRTLSISYPAGTPLTNENRGSKTQLPEELMLDYVEITSIPPLPLWVLLTADKEASGQRSFPEEAVRGYEELFDMNASEDNLDELLEGESDQHKRDRRQSVPENPCLSQFGSRQAQILSQLLTHTHLPGLSSLDQMHLLALADTVATCNKNFSEKFINDPSKTNKEISGNILTDSLDDCGLRYLFAMKHFSYLLRCLPLNQRAQFQKNGLRTSNIVWAFHSESEEELLHLIPSYINGDLKWLTLKELGVGYWLRSVTLLKQCIDKLAKSAYQSRQEPLDAALYYLAMKKKSIVWGLYRSKRDDKMTAFFANNFAEDRWRKAALKNAFVLLGKQRFEHAVAFFLLANSLNDAIEVCINKLDDFQLALVISRLYEGDTDINSPPTYRKLLCEHILGCNVDCTVIDKSKAHPDPFLRSMAYWILKRYADSLNTLLESGVGHNHSHYKEENILKNEIHEIYPNVFNFYVYLRTHPLLIRQHIAITAQEKKITQVVLSGFSYSGDPDSLSTSDKQLQIEDTITPIERQLYFKTAHGHFRAGCPVLALEVLNKLPMKVIDSNSSTDTTPLDNMKVKLINTGIIEWSNINQEVYSNLEEEFEIKWDDGNNYSNESSQKKEEEINIGNVNEEYARIDIMSQQLKFVACLKILMEELSTLATGFEVDGGQLRYQLYVWLEKEVDALKQLCNYCNADKNSVEEIQTIEFSKEKDEVKCAIKTSDKLSLHEILMQEKYEFEAKVMRAARRKRWLKANETLLRTLLSYCSLHGAGGGGLASVRMELILLLQELQQEKSQQQLLSPLPFPTTLPLLSACIAGNKTVIADPIKYLQSQTQDMLQCIVETSPIPGSKLNNLSGIFALRDLSIALSSCIYQSLCDSESFVVNKSISIGYQSPGIESIAKLYASYECSYLMGNSNIYHRKRKYSIDEPANIWTLPSKWPGVTNLRALLVHEKDDDIPKLNVLLLESFVATYMSLFVYALSTCDSRILYRIICHNFSNETWSSIFGGGIRKLLRKATSQNIQMQNLEETVDDNTVWNTVTTITKQRVKLNMKLLGPFNSKTTPCNMKEDKPTYREQFVPPEMSMLSYLLTKPQYLADQDDNDYDSNDPYESEDDDRSYDDHDSNNKINSNKLGAENTEHLNPMSRSWTMMRLALMKLTSKKLRDFINIAGIEIQDLPVLSPLVHEVLRRLNRWQDIVLHDLKEKGPFPGNYIPGCLMDNDIEGPTVQKYIQLLDKNNTPFILNASSGSVRRLWNFLVREEYVQDLFIKLIFSNKSCNSKIIRHSLGGEFDNVFENVVNQNEPIRIIHKDHESILSFCVNNISPGQVAISNPREIQELDISLLLESPNWYEDDCDYEMMNLTKDMDTILNAGFLVVHSQEKYSTNSTSNTAEISYQTSPGWQSGRGTSLVLRHKVDNVKRISAHPLMPLYLTGGQDGSVQIWEWGHQQVVCTPRTSGAFAKVTRCRFSEQGNKFGVADGDGNISLWQAGIATQNNKSFYTHQCHNKIISDFAFLGSCSFIATAGFSSENKNVVLWDTLLPIKKSCVSSFNCHEQGSSCVVFAPQHQILISCGKKGDVCIFDLRQRIIRNRYQAHESSIKCVALDPNEEYFVTGSAEGDIKIWSLNNFSLLYVFPGEHAKNSFFKHMGQGVSQLHLDAFGRLFSCGSDGCMKVRQLVEKETMVHSVY